MSGGGEKLNVLPQTIDDCLSSQYSRCHDSKEKEC